jgi:hypothetical protein
MVCPWSVIP